MWLDSRWNYSSPSWYTPGRTMCPCGQKCWLTLGYVLASVGVIAIVVCITAAVLLTGLAASWRWGVFSAGRVG